MQAVIVEGSAKEISELVKELRKEKSAYELEMELFEKTHSGNKVSFYDMADKDILNEDEVQK